MKCCQCGAELQDNALFCRECGAKQKKSEVRFCRECGAQITSEAQYCNNCGAKVRQFLNLDKEVVNETQTQDLVFPDGTKNLPAKKEMRITAKCNPYVWTAIVVTLVVAAVLIMVVNNQKAQESEDMTIIPVSVVQESEHTITKGKQYAYMSDEYNVYVAEAISDSIVKIEHWDKNLSISFSVGYKEDSGTFNINDPNSGFAWLDEGHTAFILPFRDKENSRLKQKVARVFTLCINDDNKNKGTAYDKRIRCFSYGCDECHKYRAVPLNDHLIKIECWYRNMRFGDFGYGWTWGVIDINNNNQGFQWTDDQHMSFTLTTHDRQNYDNWETDQLVVFTLENPKYSYESMNDFISR